jgi:hypothetical protein
LTARIPLPSLHWEAVLRKIARSDTPKKRIEHILYFVKNTSPSGSANPAAGQKHGGCLTARNLLPCHASFKKKITDKRKYVGQAGCARVFLFVGKGMNSE